MNDKRDIKNTVIATVIASLIISIILWCVDHFYELPSVLHQKGSMLYSWFHSSDFIVLGIAVVCVFMLRSQFRSSLKSRVLSYRKKLLKLLRIV